jgi:uncharacterized protein YegP (UPF0339 family)
MTDGHDFASAPVSRPRVKVYRDESAAWRWRRIAANGRITASSGESFASHWDARRAGERANSDAYVDHRDYTPPAEPPHDGEPV